MAPRRGKAVAHAKTTTTNNTTKPPKLPANDKATDTDTDLSDYDSGIDQPAPTNTKATSKKRKAKKQASKPQGNKKQLKYLKRYGEAPEAKSLLDDADDQYPALDVPNDPNPWAGITQVRQDPKVVSLHVNSNAGAMGTININIADILASAGLKLALNSVALGTPGVALENAPSALSKNDKVATTKNRVIRSSGFLKIPGELRDKIYRLLLLGDKPVNFDKRTGFGGRSVAFLRTCKTIAEEGTDVLYGEHSFHLARTPQFRGKFFEKDWSEIAYQDIRRFLETIGPVNISKMKFISFAMTDGPSRLTQALPNVEHLRFANDPTMHHILRLIGDNASLTRLGLLFSGRGKVTGADFHFLNALTEIKCNQLDLFGRGYPGAGDRFRVDRHLVPKLRELMVVKREDDENIDLKKHMSKVEMVYKDSHIFATNTTYFY
ncbi:hypothetical protein LTR84_000775 [Exophiala bonariae]|uniref:Uncharacterized protein n=1 Tax=Exophiala bonariae TaxID=1690606 RepID=A0AAV9NRI6_9EURO|nr:hypothetical protein LTR84_000775 [Exophiala bonariae]